MENINIAKSSPITQESIERERAILHDAFEFDPVKRAQDKLNARPAKEVFAEVYESAFGK